MEDDTYYYLMYMFFMIIIGAFVLYNRDSDYGYIWEIIMTMIMLFAAGIFALGYINLIDDYNEDDKLKMSENLESGYIISNNKHVPDTDTVQKLIIFNKKYHDKISKENKKIIKKCNGILFANGDKINDMIYSCKDNYNKKRSFFDRNLNFLLNTEIIYINTGTEFKQKVDSLPKTLITLEMNTVLCTKFNIDKNIIKLDNLPNKLRNILYNVNIHRGTYYFPNSLEQIKLSSHGTAVNKHIIVSSIINVLNNKLKLIILPNSVKILTKLADEYDIGIKILKPPLKLSLYSIKINLQKKSKIKNIIM